MQRAVKTALFVLLTMPMALGAQHAGRNPSGIGAGPSFLTKCFVDTSRWDLRFDQCEGFPRRSLFTDDTLAQSAHGRWVAGLRWQQHATPLKLPVDSGTKLVVVRSILHPQDMPIDQLKSRGLVTMHIVADPRGPLDKTFGIGVGATDTLTSNFYMVVDPSGSRDIGRSPDSTAHPLRRWHLFGVTRHGRLIKVHSKGRLNWCGGDHSDSLRTLGSANQNCQTATQLTLASKSPAAQGEIRARGFSTWMKSLRQDELTLVGVWLTCGTGCCTAELM